MITFLGVFLLSGMLGTAAAFSVDVKTLEYTDYSGPTTARRAISYDFSASPAPVSGNTITLPASAVPTQPPIDGTLTYTFGPYPSSEGKINDIAVALSAASAKATLTTASDGGCILNTTATPSSPPVPQWTYAVKLANFADMTDSTKNYSASIGMGSMDPGVNPEYSITFGPGEGAARSVTLRAQIRDDSSDTVIAGPYPTTLTGFTAASSITLRIHCLDQYAGGNSMVFEYSLDGTNWINVGTVTVAAIPSAFPQQSFPGRYPYASLWVGSGGGTADPFHAFSAHESWLTGKYRASFFVEDPGTTDTRTYSAMTVESVGIPVESPGYLAQTAMVHQDNHNWQLPNQNWPDLGTSLPSITLTYKFTATKRSDSATVIEQRMISGYVKDFVTVSSPAFSGDSNSPTSVAAAPTFIWSWPTAVGTQPTQPSWYNIYASDWSDGNRMVWQPFNNQSTSQTSVPYTGPLVNGHTYQYTIMAGDNGGNSSAQQGYFKFISTGTISFSGWVKAASGWPDVTGATPVIGATVKAYNTTQTQTGVTASVDSTTGAFTVTGIPAGETFYLVAEGPGGYQPALSKLMASLMNIEASLPFILFTPTQYSTTLGNTAGNGIILGRVSLANSPTTFLSGATVTATQWVNGAATGVAYPVTYTGGGSSTASDGLYMVKNVPTGTLVRLVASLTGYTFAYNGSVVPAQDGPVSEDSFFAMPTGGGTTISFSGYLKVNSDDTPISGATIQQAGSPAVSTTTDANGFFMLAGLPSGPAFSVKLTGDATYVPTYSSKQNSTTNITAARTFNLYTPNELSNLGVTSGNGMIAGRVVNSANTEAGYISGATANATSLLGNTYTVRYEDASGNLTTGTGTHANGKYLILNVAEGDTVTVTASQSNYPSFQSPQFVTHGSAVSQGIVKGTAAAGRVAIGSYVMNPSSGTGIKGATIEQVGATAPINATASNGDGFFYLTVPSATTFQVKISKPQATSAMAPTYSGNLNYSAENLGIGNFNLYLLDKLTAAGPFSTNVSGGGWGMAAGKGIIVSKVVDDSASMNPLPGAVVTAASANHPAMPYTVCYDNECSGGLVTPANGGFIVKNVEDGDTVTVTATMDGYMFNTRIFPIHGSSVHQGRVTGTAVPTSNLLQNGGFSVSGSASLNGWVVNPAVQTGTPPWTPLLSDGSGVTLHPATYGYMGTILYQNLNLTGVAGKTLGLWITLTNSTAYTTGNTVEVWLTYLDSTGSRRVRVLNPANNTITSGTVVNGSFTVPAEAQKIVKLELVKADYGEFHADSVVLWAEGITAGATPIITSLSAPSGAYGAGLTITGTNFGASPGIVKIGGIAAAVTQWQNTSIQVSIASPVPSGPVLVITGGVESNVDKGFQVTSPYYAALVTNSNLKVIKGQAAEFLIKTGFYNGFTTTSGIGLQLQGGSASTLSGKATFLPVPVMNPGGVLLKINTADLAVGTYTVDVVAVNGTEIVPAGTLNLQVVTVSDIKFYEMVAQTYPNPSIRVDLTSSKSIDKQGKFDIYTEVIGSDGKVFSGDPGIVLSEVAGTSGALLRIYKRFWGYDLYAQVNGTTQLKALAPDGTSRSLAITVGFPLTSYISSIGFNTGSTVYNNRTEPITFSAFANTSVTGVGMDTAGLMNFQTSFLADDNRPVYSGSGDSWSATSTFRFLKTPADIGTAIFYANTQSALAAVPLTTVNAPGTALLALGVRNLDDTAHAEMFKVSFYGTDNLLKFTKEVYGMHVGTQPVLVGNIPPGIYKLLIAPTNTSVMPQWWPNAANISGASALTFAADGTVGDIYFFAQSQPTGATLSLAATSKDFTTTAAGTGSVNVTASDPGYVWGAASDALWITITSAPIGSGNGTVSFSVAANPYGASRTGTLTIGGQTFTVNQAGSGTFPAHVGTWGAQQLIHFDTDVPWYAGVSRTTFNEDGTGTLVIKKNDHNGELINQTKTFTYSIAANVDGSMAITLTIDGQAMTERLVVSDDGKMGIVDGASTTGQQKLMVLYKIDATRTYSVADLYGAYYNVGFERNATGVNDPPPGTGNGKFMAISGIHTFSGTGTYNYFGKANSVKIDGSNVIWDDPGMSTDGTYAVAADGTMTVGGGAFQGWLTGNVLAGGGGGAFVNGINNQVAYFFLKKGDRAYTTANMAGKWAIVSFGQDSKTTTPTSEGFSASIGTMICDTAGNCAFKVKDRWSGNNTTSIDADQIAFAVAADGSFGASFGGQSPAYAGVIGNNGNTIMLNPSMEYATGADPYHREILIGIRASNIGDLAGGTAFLKGDINGDGKVDLADLVLVAKVLAGLAPAGIRDNYATSGADVNGDYVVGAHEAIYILQYLGGVRP